MKRYIDSMQCSIGGRVEVQCYDRVNKQWCYIPERDYTALQVAGQAERVWG